MKNALWAGPLAAQTTAERTPDPSVSRTHTHTHNFIYNLVWWEGMCVGALSSISGPGPDRSVEKVRGLDMHKSKLVWGEGLSRPLWGPHVFRAQSPTPANAYYNIHWSGDEDSSVFVMAHAQPVNRKADELRIEPFTQRDEATRTKRCCSPEDSDGCEHSLSFKFKYFSGLYCTTFKSSCKVRTHRSPC